MALISSTLNEFYSSAKAGTSVADFQVALRGVFARPRSDDDLKDHRLNRRSWKKFADEVTPVSRFLRFRGIESGQIQFPLDLGKDKYPDCWLYKDGGDGPVGIEVTIAQARERYHLANELVETGEGRGFIGVSDDAARGDFDRAMSGSRKAYSNDQALSSIRDGICRCLSRKNKPKFAGFVLLIQAPLLDSLPQERWESIKDDLCAAATALPFREIHVIDGMDCWGFQIK